MNAHLQEEVDCLFHLLINSILMSSRLRTISSQFQWQEVIEKMITQTTFQTSIFQIPILLNPKVRLYALSEH
jgi:DNA replication protein DnaC